MAMQQTFFGRAKSIAGAALVGLGIFIFHGNLDRAATQWSHLLSTTPGAAPGVLATVILAAPRVLQAYGADHQRVLQGFLRHIFLSCWPLLLVTVGTGLSRDNHGGCQGAFQDRMWTCRSHGQPARKVYYQSTLRPSA